MGCGCAKIGKTKDLQSDAADDGNNRRLQKVSFSMGPDLQELHRNDNDNEKPLVVFIFGGPGSFKGRVVDDLIQAYGFIYINAEELILEQLPKKLNLCSQLDSIMDLIQLLNDDDSVLNIEWLFEIIALRVNRKPQASYLIDIVTNLRVLLRCEALNRGHANCLRRFEEKFPVLFAIDLAIPQDKIIQNVASHYAASTGKNVSAEELKRENARQSDEVDLSKTQKRANLYESNAKPYLDYFAQRLISVDVSCAMPDSISFKICDLCREQGIVPLSAPKSNIIFSFSENEFPELDHSLYGLHKIVLADSIGNSNMAIEELLTQLCGEIKKKLCVTRNVFVELFGTDVTKHSLKSISSRGVSFVEVMEGPLDYFIPVDALTDDKKLFTAQSFKAIVSPEGDTCIYHNAVNTSVCVTLARFIAQSKSSKDASNSELLNSAKSKETSIEVIPINPVDSV